MTIQDYKRNVKQYRYIKTEIADLQSRIHKSSKVTDVVVGSSSEHPFTQHPIQITGCDYYISDRLYKEYVSNIKTLQLVVEEIERQILSIDDSLVRQSARLKIFDGLSWVEIADKLGGKNTVDSVRKAFSRYMLKQEKQEAPH